jgi:hypothetical protein
MLRGRGNRALNLSTSSRRRPGPIRRGLSLKAAVGGLSRNTTSCGYGSRPSPGRRLRGASQTHLRILAAQSARVLLASFASEVRGRRECRAPGAPAAACAKIVSKKAHALVRSHRKHPALPAQWFYGFLRALPGDRALLPPSSVDRSTNLTPASRRQDHTTSPSASAPFVKGASASTASRLTLVTIAKRPSMRRGSAIIALIWGEPERKYFRASIWTPQITLIRLDKLVFSENRESGRISRLRALSASVFAR